MCAAGVVEWLQSAGPWIGRNAEWFVRAVVPTLVGVLVGYLLSRTKTKGEMRRQEMAEGYARISPVLVDYEQWLLSLQYLVDFTERRRHLPASGAQDDVIESHVASAKRRLFEEERCAEEVLECFVEGQYDSLGLTQEFIDKLAEVIAAVDEYWRALKKRYVGQDNTTFDLLIRNLARGSVGLTELDSRELDIAVAVVHDTRRQLLRMYKQHRVGKAAIRRADAERQGQRDLVVELKRGKLSYKGQVPFKSEEYLGALEQPPWRRDIDLPPSGGDPHDQA